MLAIFHKAFAHPPPELESPEYSTTTRSPKHPEEILRSFHSSHPTTSFSATFTGGAALALSGSDGHHFFLHQRKFSAVNEVYCMFVGSLYNLSSLIRDYGLCKSTDDAMMLIEAYRTLRDRGPYPADQVVGSLAGSFAFVLYDHRAQTVFTALSADGGIPLFWGIAADGSIVITDDSKVVKASCGKSFAPFPPGCMFHSEGGLRSFEHPMNKMKAMPRVDSEGVMCGASFKVDLCSKINSIPHVGSSANWSAWEDTH